MQSLEPPVVRGHIIGDRRFNVRWCQQEGGTLHRFLFVDVDPFPDVGSRHGQPTRTLDATNAAHSAQRTPKWACNLNP